MAEWEKPQNGLAFECHRARNRSTSISWFVMAATVHNIQLQETAEEQQKNGR